MNLRSRWARVSVLLSVLKKGSLNYSIKPVDTRYIVISKKDNNKTLKGSPFTFVYQ